MNLMKFRPSSNAENHRIRPQSLLQNAMDEGYLANTAPLILAAPEAHKYTRHPRLQPRSIFQPIIITLENEFNTLFYKREKGAEVAQRLIKQIGELVRVALKVIIPRDDQPFIFGTVFDHWFTIGLASSRSRTQTTPHAPHPPMDCVCFWSSVNPRTVLAFESQFQTSF